MTSEEAQRIRTVYESRKDQYKAAEFKYAIVRKEGDNLFLRGLLAFTNEKRQSENRGTTGSSSWVMKFSPLTPAMNSSRRC